ncbi:MAG TPA: hypothetical protein VK152_11300, partial [Paludibacter sp.]|nr:hypothetical protein [Paludibacter sp.]
MKKTVSLAAIFIVLISTPVRSQLAMGKWRTHLAYNNVSEIEQSDNKVYAVSEGSLYSIDKLDRNIEFYSKITGLNGYNITRIGFDSTNKQLVIAYANGNIDIMGSGGVTNVPDLYNKQMSANKGVNHILFSRNKAYLSCNFGILALNLQKKEISDTYFIGPNASEVKVLATAVSNGNIYALTPTALYEAPVNDPFLINYQKWKTTGALPDSGVVKSIVSFAGKIFLHRGERLYFLNNDNTWSAFLPELSVSGFSTSDGIMCIYSSNSVYIADNQLNIKNIPNLSTISDAEYDTENSTYWFAANSNGVVTYKENGTSNPIKPAGPAVNMPWDMTFSGDKLFVVPGGRWSDQNHNKGKVMMYEDGNWINIYGEDIQTVTGRNPLDFLNV